MHYKYGVNHNFRNKKVWYGCYSRRNAPMDNVGTINVFNGWCDKYINKEVDKNLTKKN